MFKGVKNGRFERIRGLLKCRLKEMEVRKKFGTPKKFFQNVSKAFMIKIFY
jgi:hypothetical protein